MVPLRLALATIAIARTLLRRRAADSGLSRAHPRYEAATALLAGLRHARDAPPEDDARVCYAHAGCVVEEICAAHFRPLRRRDAKRLARRPRGPSSRRRAAAAEGGG